MTTSNDRREFLDRMVRVRDERRREIDAMITRRDEAKAAVRRITESLETRGVSERVMKAMPNRRAASDDAEALSAQIDQGKADVDVLDERIAEERAEIGRMGEGNPDLERVRHGGGASESRVWAQQAAQAVNRSFGGEHRGVVSGTIDIPNLVVPYVTDVPWPVRLIDLIVNRTVAESNSFIFYQQTVKTNNAAPVADLATKPTSVFTVAEHSDRCRVVAHLSQPVPYRYLLDAPQLQDFLAREMYQGVMSALEAQIISGDGTGENMLGLLTLSHGTTPLTTNVDFDTDALTTLRHAQTELQLLGEVPNAIALHPSDAEAIDVQRWGASGGLLSSGFQHPNTVGYGSSDNYFGPSDQIKRVISPSVPAGTGIVGDWSQLKIFVREDFTLMMNMYGDAEFSTNSYLLRGEGRYGIGVLRPQAFAVCDLTA
jgi:HK97 family phage major capsid protein